MDLKQLHTRYEKHYATLGDSHQPEQAAQLAVGGDFEAIGALEFFALKAHGLSSEHFVVDIGCGTGRLACQLARRGHQRYAGFDIMGSAVAHARDGCERPDWAFGVTDGLHIAVPDGVADFACFFSVFTHVTHEHTYLYLKEAHRLLKPGGLVVFSFLEFLLPAHWAEFEQAAIHFGLNSVPVVFLDRQAITRFAFHLGYEVLVLVDGDKPTFPIDEDIILADGQMMKGRGFLGQSLGVLRKL
jgi:SAM-dependent methyltransferase